MPEKSNQRPGQGKRASSGHTEPTIKLKTYRSRDGRLSLDLPVRPANLSENASRPYWQATKEIAIRLEGTNTRFLIVYHRYGKWWQMGGASLLIYIHHLAKTYPIRELKPHLDRDFTSRWDNNPGCAAISDIVGFTTELQNKVQATLFLETPDLLIFALRKAYPKEILENYRNIRLEREKRVNTVLMPKVMDPLLKNACAELNRLIINKVANLTPAKREMLIKTGVESSNWLALNFIRMARGRIQPQTFYRQANSHLENIEDWIVYARTYSVFSLDDEEKIVAAWIAVKEALEKAHEKESH